MNWYIVSIVLLSILYIHQMMINRKLMRKYDKLFDEHGMITRAYINMAAKANIYRRNFESCLNILDPEQSTILKSTIQTIKEHDGTQSK